MLENRTRIDSLIISYLLIQLIKIKNNLDIIYNDLLNIYH